jgi:hypothetical protein
MLRKFYSNSGLILITVLAAGVWTSNIQDFLAARSAAKPTFLELLEAKTRQQPSPMPSAVGVLEFDRQPQRLSPTAICSAGNYSYSISRRQLC